MTQPRWGSGSSMPYQSSELAPIARRGLAPSETEGWARGTFDTAPNSPSPWNTPPAVGNLSAAANAAVLPAKRGINWVTVLGLLACALAVMLLLATLSARLSEAAGLPANPEPVATAASSSSPSALLTSKPEKTETPIAQTGLPARTWEKLPGGNSKNPDWVTLQQSPIYAADFPTLSGCPTPSYVRSSTQLKEQVTAQMDCIQQAWAPTLQKLGLSDRTIPIYFFSGASVETPCGTISAPALYCSAQGGAIYFGPDALAETSIFQLGVKDLTSHEYGHHVQALAGFFSAQYAVDQSNEGLRRIELQATCWAYAAIANDNSVTLDSETYDSIEPFLQLIVEDGVHGSKKSIAYWGIRGLYSTDLGNCNTWTVDSGRVS